MCGGYLFDVIDTCKRIKIRLNKDSYLHNIPQQDSSVHSYRILCIHCSRLHFSRRALFTIIFNYLQLLTTIYNYLELFTTIYNYLQLFTIIYNYSQFSFTLTTFWPQSIIYNYFQLFTIIYSY